MHLLCLHCCFTTNCVLIWFEKKFIQNMAFWHKQAAAAMTSAIQCHARFSCNMQRPRVKRVAPQVISPWKLWGQSDHVTGRQEGQDVFRLFSTWVPALFGKESVPLFTVWLTSMSWWWWWWWWRVVLGWVIFHSDDKHAAFRALLLKLCDSHAWSSRFLITWVTFLQSFDPIDI